MSLVDVLVFAINSVFPVILIVALGYFLKTIKLFTPEFLRIANKTVFTVLLPVLLFTNIGSTQDFSYMRLDAVLYIIATIVVLVLIGFAMAPLAQNTKQKGVVIQSVFRSNFALIGVPLAQIMAGDEGVRCAAVLSAITIPTYNILSVVILSMFNGENDGKGMAGKKIKSILLNVVKNPLIIGVAAGVIFALVKPYWALTPAGLQGFVGQFKFLNTALDYLAKSATPVALLVLGGQFELSRIKGLKNQIMVCCLGRLVIAPIFGFGGAIILNRLGIVHFDNAVFAAFVSIFGTPVAVASAIMAEELKADGPLARQTVVWSTLFSAVTLFVLVAILRALGYL